MKMDDSERERSISLINLDIYKARKVPIFIWKHFNIIPFLFSLFRVAVRCDNP